jgi:peroxiredoxin
MERSALVFVVATWLAIPLCIEAAEAKTELELLMRDLKAQVTAGKAKEELATEAQRFDRLQEKYQDQAEDAGEVLLAKALFVGEVLEDERGAMGLLEEVQADFPETAAAKKARAALAALMEQAEQTATERNLRVGTKFPDFHERDLQGKPLTLARYRGQIVLIEFWATWCEVCLGELPALVETYRLYRDRGFEVVGVSLDTDLKKLAALVAEKEIPWPQFSDGKGWENKLAVKYGVNRIPTTYLLDRSGRILGKNLSGKALRAEVEKALETR